MNGYHDRIAWIDLSRRHVDIRPIGAKDAADFIGGGNLGAAILARLTDAGTNPLSRENPLIFMVGPFTGTRIPAGSRFEVVALSPLTGVYGESNCGGEFGVRLKHAGLDGLVFTGSADRPVTLVIDGEDIAFRDAEDLWGLDTFETDDKLKAELGESIVAASIGQAGEHLVHFACICQGGRHTRVAGRCGMGAVMGSKRLKAVIITKGERPAPVADANGLQTSIKAALPTIRERSTDLATWGTARGVINYDRLGNLPIKNWQDARAPELAGKITGQVIRETLKVSRTGCKTCPIGCGCLVEVKEGPYATDGAVEGPEYESVAALGSFQLNDNLEVVIKANELCNRFGIDTMSTGGVIGFANECYEKGVLTRSDTDGVELGFGKPPLVLEMIERIAFAKGDFARTLGLGSRRAAQIFGGAAEEYANHVKGLELPYHDPRFSWGQALGQAVGNRGACHLTTLAHAFERVVELPEIGYPEPFPSGQVEGKAQHVVDLQNLMNLEDSLISCKISMNFNSLSLANFHDWYNLVTGRGLAIGDFMAIGARGFTLKRMINNRRGITRKDDILPPRMRTLRKVGEDVDLDVPPLEPMLADFYALRGWTEEGRPTPETIKEHGLGEFSDDRLSNLGA